MPVKKYGLYLGYGPTEDLRSAGLGRFLGEFLRASRKVEDSELIVVAPSWLRKPMRDLLEEFYIDRDDIKVVTPKTVPMLWRIYSAAASAKRWLYAYRHRYREEKVQRSVWIMAIERRIHRLSGAIVSVRNPLLVILLVIIAALITPLAAMLLLAWRAAARLAKNVASRVSARRKTRQKRSTQPNFERLGIRGRLQRSIYKLIVDNELSLVAELANRQGVTAWYIPAAFWPQIAELSSPKLVCVPDVVFKDFPTGFASAENGGIFALESFQRIKLVIAAADHLVTYSDHVKEHTLMEQFHVAPDTVSVVPHGNNRLDRHVTVNGFPDNAEAGRALARQYLRYALGKCKNNGNASKFAGEDVSYLFYASQFRPNKNILILLRAFKELRRDFLLPHKLILTGDPAPGSAVAKYLDEHQLHDDVYCLRGLSEKELAACYMLADLAVNPSLSEGGMPFTFAEAISVGTPAIMADIAVTREIINDDQLRSLMLFNPNDPESVKLKIIEALDKKEELERAQQEFYANRILPRSWERAARDYMDALESVAQKGSLSVRGNPPVFNGAQQ